MKKRRTVSGVLIGFSLTVFVVTAYLGGVLKDENPTKINGNSKNKGTEGVQSLYNSLEFSSVSCFVSSLNNLLPLEGYKDISLITSYKLGSTDSINIYSSKNKDLTIYADKNNKVLSCKFKNTSDEVKYMLKQELKNNKNTIFSYKETSTGFSIEPTI